IPGRGRFEQGAAFNPEELSPLTPRPTLAIVSGLHELFPDHPQAHHSLPGLPHPLAPAVIPLSTPHPSPPPPPLPPPPSPPHPPTATPGVPRR
ncbi:hypothetical protein CWI62_27645, partial [Escherichia coli]